jgi:hypothetical protein
MLHHHGSLEEYRSQQFHPPAEITVLVGREWKSGIKASAFLESLAAIGDVTRQVRTPFRIFNSMLVQHIEGRSNNRTSYSHSFRPGI